MFSGCLWGMRLRQPETICHRIKPLNLIPSINSFDFLGFIIVNRFSGCLKWFTIAGLFFRKFYKHFSNQRHLCKQSTLAFWV